MLVPAQPANLASTVLVKAWKFPRGLVKPGITVLEGNLWVHLLLTIAQLVSFVLFFNMM
jgi:hypothetical protein